MSSVRVGDDAIVGEAGETRVREHKDGLIPNTSAGARDPIRSSVVRRHEITLLLLWSLIATISLTRGVLNSLRPGQSQDLKLVYIWVWEWLWHSTNPYSLANLQANYPPHAIVFLSPLTLIPEGFIAAVWSALNVALAPLVGVLAWRLTYPAEPRVGAVLPTVMFLAWGGLRIGLGNGQLSMLMMCLGFLAVAFADDRPASAGTALGLSMMKPHIGGAFLLWALLTKRFIVVAVGVLVMVFGLAVFSIRLAENPVAVLDSLLAVLRKQFSGSSFLEGGVELRPLAHLFSPSFAFGETLNLAILLLCLTATYSVSMMISPLSSLQRDAIVLQLCCLWALLGVFHNTYDMVLMLPVLLGLWPSLSSHATVPWPRSDRFAVALLQAALVLEIPGLWWRLSNQIDLSPYGLMGQTVSHLDRILVVSSFAYVFLRGRALLGSKRS